MNRMIMLFIMLNTGIIMPVWGEAYKCPQQDGKVIYQQQPCQTGEGETINLNVAKPSMATEFDNTADQLERSAIRLRSASKTFAELGNAWRAEDALRKAIKAEEEAAKAREQAQILRQRNKNIRRL